MNTALPKLLSLIQVNTNIKSKNLLYRTMTSAATSVTSNDQKRIKTAILMMNMGGPESNEVEDVQMFLSNLFKDRDIINMPFQAVLGPLISKFRAPGLKAKYEEIGGDPLLDWTTRQGAGIVAYLDKKSPATGPHKAYCCFRYSRPDIEQSVEELERDKAERVVILSKYPQYSCSTTGSNLNDISRYCVQVKNHLTEKPKQKWSLIDRWPIHKAIVDVYADRIEEHLAKMPENIRNEAIILFSAHSIPIWMVERGDDYTGEVGATVQAVLAKLNRRNPASLVWQSKVGFKRWQGPSIVEAIEGYVENGHKHFLVVPVAFVNEHVETLHELDIEYAKEMKSKLKFETFERVPALNDHSKFLEGMADLIMDHLDSKVTINPQMRRRCPGCTKDSCKQTRTWLSRIDEVNREFSD